jgi:PAS domain S-box-containing protein
MTLPDGQYGVICYYYDSTRLREAERALRQSEERFRAMANAMPQLAWISRPDGHLTWYNQRWYDYTGTTPEQMEGWGWQSVHDPVELPSVLERWKSSIATGEPFEMTFPLRGADGIFRLFLTRGFPLKDASGKVVQWFGTNTDITELKRAEAAIEASLHEKEVMLKEIHHRVKNNLQVISSLLNLQADAVPDQMLGEVFNEMSARVRSMALVHEKLYGSESLARVDFAEYAQSLLVSLWRANRGSEISIQLKTDLQPLSFSVVTAIPCGLVLNELASNTLKHAFRGRTDGEVNVELRSSPEGRVCLTVKDNGVGMPPNLDWRKSPSLGLRLAQMLVQQLDGNLEVKVDGGTEFKVTFLRPDIESARNGKHDENSHS